MFWDSLVLNGEWSFKISESQNTELIRPQSVQRRMLNGEFSSVEHEQLLPPQQNTRLLKQKKYQSIEF